MKKQICIIILLLTGRICDAQNLVQNGDFEQYVSCPTYISQLDTALYWFNPTHATPDYFNVCVTPFWASVPYNFMGYQFAHSGVGYAGLIQLAAGTNWREYIEVQLLSPLVANACYQFQVYISAGDDCVYKTDALQVYFSDTAYNSSTTNILQLIPQISNVAGNVPDTMNWMQITANYTAIGGEQYFIMGNFNDSINTSLNVANPGGIHDFAYLFIDDVCLTPCGSSCTTGIAYENENADIYAFPNPFSDKLNFIIGNKDSEIILYDITSRKVLQQNFINSISINTEQLAKGIYLYEVRSKNGVIKKGKVVKD
jgi:hypothetical protein